MASRKDQKEAARQRRLAEEQAAARKAQRTRRLQMVGGVVAAAIVVVVVLVVVSSNGGNARAIAPHSARATAAVASVDRLLAGIPQHGNTLGSPHTRVTVTEYGDLVCPVCQSFALGAESRLIANDVRAGRVRLVYRALETASSIANGPMFVPSQQAALAAGEQKLGWNYIELFYHEQRSEDSSYVTANFLQGLAKQIPRLDFARWSSDRSSSALAGQVNADMHQAQAQGFQSTPTILVQGPVAHAQPIVGAPAYGQLEKAIRSVA